MTELVIRNYQWPEVTKDVKRDIDRCNLYQRMKNKTKALAEKLMINKISEKMWTHLIGDFITKLLLVAKKNVILIVCNQLLKMAYFVTITKGTLTEGLARLFRDNMQKLHGLLESMISDRGPQFVVQLIMELNKILEIEMKLLIVFHLQTNRQIKQKNQELEQYLRLTTVASDSRVCSE